jgi:phosphoribosylformylglycinamidine synthase subunit PurS
LIKTIFCLKILFFNQIMKAKVYVTLKPSVLDPKVKAIHHSSELLGFNQILDVRQGKYFEIQLAEGLSETEASETATRIAKDVLANPVIEDFRVEIG